LHFDIIYFDSSNRTYDISSLYIFFKNISLILIVYAISLITNKYGIFIVSINGFIIGIFIAASVMNDIVSLWLLLPHGIIEIPSIIYLGYISENGMILVKEEPKKLLKILAIHILITALAAAIETYITPQIYLLFRRY